MVTLLLALWDPALRQLTVATAGHPPLLLFDGSEVREVGQERQPLGVDLGGEDGEQRIACPGPAVLVAFSDGVVEATSPGGESFGYQRWPERLPDLVDGSAEEILTELLEQVGRHRRGSAPTDDVTAVVAKLTA